MRKTLPAILLIACVMASLNAGAVDLSKKAPAAAKAITKVPDNLPLFVPEMSYKGEPNLAGELFVPEMSYKGEENLAGELFVPEMSYKGEPNLAGELFVPEMSYKGEPNLAGDLFVPELSFKGVIEIPRVPEKAAPRSANAGLGTRDISIKNKPANFGKLPASSAQRAPARTLRPTSPRPPTRDATGGAGLTGSAVGVEAPVDNYKP